MRDVPAYAKINLTLDVLGRRDDGYHDLRSIMQTVSLCDTLTLEPAPGPDSAAVPGLPEDSGNLVVRAVAAFRAVTGLPETHLRIGIEKRIPVCAGLGGGSADAAAVLRALRNRWAPDMTGRTLAQIGAAVGSDVPFCVLGGTCLAEGRGEILTRLPSILPCWIVLCKPDSPLSTPALFRAIDAVSDLPRPDSDGALAALEAGDLAALCRCVGNVFEAALTGDQAATVAAIKARLLDAGALAAAMSGSGSAVFGVFAEEETAAAAVGALLPDFSRTWLTRPVGRLI